ncbi:MAG: polyprenyl synthetase family protein [Candidatus Saccharimonadales bacterium]
MNDYLADKQRVEAVLTAFFKRKLAAAEGIDQVYADVVARVAELVARGGKRMRPQLVCLAYDAYGGTDLRAITQVAASQELFHAFLLTHDDIVDRDTKRWGGENINGYYQRKFLKKLWTEEAAHFSNAWALLAGDACFGLSNELLLTSNFPPERLLRATNLTQKTLFEVIGGELLDIALPIFSSWQSPPSQKRLLKVCHYKTAIYSFCTPLQLGALLAGASLNQLDHLKNFGTQLGIAFQLRDDILGIFGDEKKLGKSNLSDLQEGKYTLLMTYGMKLANAGQRKTLTRLLGNPKATSADLQMVRQILKTSGALAKTETVMSGYCEKARATLNLLNLPHSAAQDLAELVTFCAERTY